MKPFETKREELLYHINDFLWNEVLLGDEDAMDAAELYAVAKMTQA